MIEQCSSKFDPLTTSIIITLKVEYLFYTGYRSDSYECYGFTLSQMTKKEKRILISLSTLTLQRILKTFAMWLEFLKMLCKVLQK